MAKFELPKKNIYIAENLVSQFYEEKLYNM